MAVSARSYPRCPASSQQRPTSRSTYCDRLGARSRGHRLLQDPPRAATAFLSFRGRSCGDALADGRFSSADADYVWGILAGSAIGLLASSLWLLACTGPPSMRCVTNAPRTPLRFGDRAVTLATMLGARRRPHSFAPPTAGIPARWGRCRDHRGIQRRRMRC